MSILPCRSRVVEQFLRIRACDSESRDALNSLVEEVFNLPWDGKTAIGEIRESTEKQVKNNYNLPAMQREIQEFCKREEITFGGTITVTGSGKTWGKMRRALDHAEKTRSAIIVPGLDRFSRQSVQTIFRECLRRRIRLIVLDRGRVVDAKEISSGLHEGRERPRNTERGIEERRTVFPNWGRRSLRADRSKSKLCRRIDELFSQGVKTAGRIEKQLRIEQFNNVPDRKTIRRYLRESQKHEVGRIGCRGDKAEASLSHRRRQ